MTISDNALNVMTTITFRGIGKAWISKNIKGNEQVEKLVAMLNNDAKENFKITRADFEDRRRTISNKLSTASDYMDGAVAIGDSNFPETRGSVKFSEKPVVLFYRGDLNLLHPSNNNIAVVGLLNPDEETIIFERKVVSELVRSSATIVSGLALGCDSVAHQEALSANGKTIAILPSTLQNILPATNTKLANQIVNQKGLLITEYYESHKSNLELKSRYQERDRLQALFSDAIILVASYTKNDSGMDSGSRLAMEYAHKYSIKRAAIYDHSIHTTNMMYNLNRHLLETDSRTIQINNNIIQATKQIATSRPAARTNKPYQHTLLNYLQPQHT